MNWNKPVFILLGGHKLHRGCCDYLHSAGYEVLMIDWNEHPAIEGDVHWQMDVKAAEAIVRRLSDEQCPVQGAYTSIDLAVPTLNAIHRRFGLKSQPAAFDTVLTKAAMREAWQRSGIFGRESVYADTLSLTEMTTWNAREKLIVKPNVAASSRGITVMDPGSDAAAFEAALKRASDTSFDHRALLEEFVEGQEFTVDMMGDDAGHVAVYAISAKYHSPYAHQNRVACKLHWNSAAIPDEVYRQVAARGKECYRSLGMRNGFGHLEMIRRPDGRLSPVEIAARGSGFIASHLVSAASRHDYFGDYIRVLHGQSIEEKDHILSDTSSMWFGYDFPPGTISVKPSDLSRFLDPCIRVMYSDRSRLTPGRRYGEILDDGGRDDNGFEMLCGPKDVLTIAHIRQAEQDFLNDYSGR